MKKILLFIVFSAFSMKRMAVIASSFLPSAENLYLPGQLQQKVTAQSGLTDKQ